jgi:hypothetical protein
LEKGGESLIRKDVVIAVLATFCLTSTLFMITTSKSQSGVGEYNPWADYDGNGTIDIFDVVAVGVSFGTDGDPTKNVNVTNWQISRDVSVWWLKDVVGGGLQSPGYNAGGFGHLHVLAHGSSLSGAETLTVRIGSRLYNGTGTEYFAVTVYTITLTSSVNNADISISVPSELFYFQALYDAAVTCSVSLSFYLTLA